MNTRAHGASLAAALLLVACATPEPEPTGCGSTAPTFDNISLADAGFVDFGGGPRQAVQFGAQGMDPDGDLHRYVVQIWLDTFVDGEVVDGLPDFEVETQVSEERCSVTDVFVGAVLPLGGLVPFSSDVEFGFVVEDADGTPSNGGEAVIWVGKTPDEEVQ